MEEIRWKQRFQNFEKAFNSLTESVDVLKNNQSAKEYNSFIQDSVIKRYEYTIELAWKTLKDFLEFEGFSELRSPKKVMRKGLQEGYVKNELWIDALDDRNNTFHRYIEGMVSEIVNDIQDKYYYLLKDLLEVLRKENR